MPSEIEKLQAYSSHLLDLFIKLRERYAVLEPMIFDESVVKEYGAKERSYGFRILRDSLFLSCAQEIAKICFDGDKRTPSIGSIVESLKSDHVQKKLCTAFSVWTYPHVEKKAEPEVYAAIQRMELREQAERKAQYNELVEELAMKWKELSGLKSLEAYRTVRDKITAHSEIRYAADKYEFVDIGDLGLKWGDMREIVPIMQRIIEILGLVVRNASFAWDILQEQLDDAAHGLWVTGETAC